MELTSRFLNGILDSLGFERNIAKRSSEKSRSEPKTLDLGDYICYDIWPGPHEMGLEFRLDVTTLVNNPVLEYLRDSGALLPGETVYEYLTYDPPGRMIKSHSLGTLVLKPGDVLKISGGGITLDTE